MKSTIVLNFSYKNIFKFIFYTFANYSLFYNYRSRYFDWWNPLGTFDKIWIIENIWLPIAETHPKYLPELITLLDDKEQLISYLSFKNKEAKFFTKSMISLLKRKNAEFLVRH
jgi:hypothetical protein